MANEFDIVSNIKTTVDTSGIDLLKKKISAIDDSVKNFNKNIASQRVSMAPIRNELSRVKNEISELAKEYTNAVKMKEMRTNFIGEKNKGVKDKDNPFKEANVSGEVYAGWDKAIEKYKKNLNNLKIEKQEYVAQKEAIMEIIQVTRDRISQEKAVQAQLIAYKNSIEEVVKKSEELNKISTGSANKGYSERIKYIEEAGRMDAKYLAESIQARQQASQASINSWKEELKLTEARLREEQKVNNEVFRGIEARLKGEGRENIATQNEQMKVDFDTERLGIANQLAKDAKISIEQLNRAFKTLGWSLNKDNKVVNAFGKEVELMGKKTKESAKNLALLKKASVRLNMGLLSIMFAAMAVQRTTQQMLRGLVTTYQRANEESEGLGKATWHLQAAWEFLKYSIMEALLQSPLFQWLVSLAIDLINEFNKLPEAVKSFTGVGIAVIFVIASIIVLLAQIGLAKTGLEGLGITFSTFKGGTLLPILGKVAMWALIIYLAYLALDNVFDVINETFGTNISLMRIIEFLLKAMGLGFRWLSFAAVAASALVANGIAAIIAILFVLVDWIIKFPEIIGWAFKLAGNLIYKYMKYPLDKIVDWVNSIIDVVNRLSRRAGFGDIITPIKLASDNKMFEGGDVEDLKRIMSEPTWASKIVDGSLSFINNMVDKMNDMEAKMIAETPTISELWNGKVVEDTSDKPSQNIVNDLNLNINVDAQADNVADQILGATDQIVDTVFDALEEKYGRNIGVARQ